MGEWMGIGMLGVWAVIGYAIVRTDKRRISRYLSRRGASNIKIEWVFWANRGEDVYNVRYLSRLDSVCYTSCKVEMWSGKIYWRDPPEV
ncbi:hypothetical protein ANRL3_02520 [Anaerolineae bacterium]|nr:hypothetical protein ANRL3_02520 [Anaerolineae bacterium]